MLINMCPCSLEFCIGLWIVVSRDLLPLFVEDNHKLLSWVHLKMFILHSSRCLHQSTCLWRKTLIMAGKYNSGIWHSLIQTLPMPIIFDRTTKNEELSMVLGKTPSPQTKRKMYWLSPFEHLSSDSSLSWFHVTANTCKQKIYFPAICKNFLQLLFFFWRLYQISWSSA